MTTKLSALDKKWLGKYYGRKKRKVTENYVSECAQQSMNEVRFQNYCVMIFVVIIISYSIVHYRNQPESMGQ